MIQTQKLLFETNDISFEEIENKKLQNDDRIVKSKDFLECLLIKKRATTNNLQMKIKN